MSESVNLPALGESVTEGTVTRWLKNVGDRVEVDEPLLEVSTDKVDTEIPSPIAGVIEQILVQERRDRRGRNTPRAHRSRLWRRGGRPRGTRRTGRGGSRRRGPCCRNPCTRLWPRGRGR